MVLIRQWKNDDIFSNNVENWQKFRLICSIFPCSFIFLSLKREKIKKGDCKESKLLL